jgi:hypothetical protein
MALARLNYRRRNFIVGTAETRKDPTSRVGHGNWNNVMDIEDFLVIRNFRLAGNRDLFFVEISHKRNYPNFGYRSERKGKKFKNPAISWRHTGILVSKYMAILKIKSLKSSDGGTLKKIIYMSQTCSDCL